MRGSGTSRPLRYDRSIERPAKGQDRRGYRDETLPVTNLKVHVPGDKVESGQNFQVDLVPLHQVVDGFVPNTTS